MVSLRPLIWIFGPATVYGVLTLVATVYTAADPELWTEVEREAGDEVVGSSECVRCHPGQFESWHRSHHRTMTQYARDGAVLAPFAGESLDYGGFRATMFRNSSGAPCMRFVALDDDGNRTSAKPLLETEIELTIGSHRYQQYAARIGGELTGEIWRLPMVWAIGDARWIHANGAFIEPESEVGDLEGYMRHLTRWNDNCLFCHNTDPVPGRQADGSFASRLGEIGIACEACHGPAGEHLSRHDNPIRRILAGRSADASITQPGRLDPRRESAVCGRCHGNRIGADMSKILVDGDGFMPGHDLLEVSRPIFRETTISGVPGLSEGQPFGIRFWPDGTPRLAAYEYQGLLLSPCYAEGEPGGMGCNHCHDSHGAEPVNLLRQGRQGRRACVDCHAEDELSGSTREGGHGGHRDVAEAVDCMSCHMPRIAYGLLDGMMSHRITIPDPGRWVGRDDMPDACTQCHVDRSRRWAVAGMGMLGFPDGRFAKSELDGTSRRLPSRVARDLHGGDPLQRVLAAHALARPDATGSQRERAAWLVDGLEDDYPAVRWAAWQGLRALLSGGGRGGNVDAIQTTLMDFDHLDPLEKRIGISSRLRGWLGPGALDGFPELAEKLHNRGRDQEIWTGE